MGLALTLFHQLAAWPTKILTTSKPLGPHNKNHVDLRRMWDVQGSLYICSLPRAKEKLPRHVSERRKKDERLHVHEGNQNWKFVRPRRGRCGRNLSLSSWSYDRQINISGVLRTGPESCAAEQAQSKHEYSGIVSEEDWHNFFMRRKTWTRV